MEYAYCQSHARTSVVMPDMGQTEKERGGAAEPLAVDNKQSNKYLKTYHNRQV